MERSPAHLDLTDRADRARVYETVLREGTEEDVRYFIDVDVLLDLWVTSFPPPDSFGKLGQLGSKRQPENRPRVLTPFQETNCGDRRRTRRGGRLCLGGRWRASSSGATVDRGTRDLDFFVLTIESVDRPCSGRRTGR